MSITVKIDQLDFLFFADVSILNAFTQICDSTLKSWYSFPQVILTGDASGGSGSRIFRSRDFGKSFIHTELPFHPLMQIMYNPQNSDVLAAISITVRAFKTLVLFPYRLKLFDIKLMSTWLALWLSLLSTCSQCVVSTLAPLCRGCRRIIQVDAAHWWWLRRDPPHDCKALWVYRNTQETRYINASFIHSFIHSFIQMESY